MVLFAAFSLAWVLVEEVLGSLLQRSYPLTQVVWCRYASHLALLLALCAWREPQRLWRTRRLRFHMMRSLLMLVMPLSFVMSIHAGAHANMTWAVFWVAPLMILLIERRIRREPGEPRPTARVIAISAACALAAAFMMWPRMWPPPGPWPLAAAAMALSLALYVVMTRSLRNEAVEANLFYTALGVFCVLTPFMPSMWVMPSLHDAAVLFGIGAVGLVGLFALDRAAAAAPLALSVSGLYVQLPLLGLVGWWLHGALTLRAAVAAAAITIAVAYLWHRLPRTAASHPLPG